jgi:ribonuclease D
MNTPWEMIESTEALDALLLRHKDDAVVALDTEFMRQNTFYPEVALVQLCFDDKAWLLDPLKIDDPTSLAALMSNQDVLKVMHSPSEDLEVFREWLQVLPRPLFDTQRAAAILDRGFGLGYRALVLELCQVDLPKGETRSNWLQRPLTESQCDYAGMDVTYLMDAWQQLDQECLLKNKRDWVLADSEDAVAQAERPAAPYYPRIKSAWKLSRQQLAALIAVCDWREQTARKRNKPRSWIIDDKACLALAEFDPGALADLSGQLDLPKPVVRRHGEELLDCLAEVRNLPDGALPDSLPKPLDAGQRNQLKSLKQRGKQLALSLEIAPESVLASKDYELLLRQSQGEAVIAPASWSGWRQAVIVEPLQRSLSGGRE